MTSQGHADAVTTQETLDGSREKTMRIANVENNALNWVSISSGGALDMTHCDFSARAARDEMRHSQVVTSRGTEHSLRESVTCRKIDQISSLHRCRCVVKWIGRYFVGKPRARCWFRWQQSGEPEAYCDADWGGDKPPWSSVSAGVITRGGHCLIVWTKKQQVVSLSSAESELYGAVKTASEGLILQKNMGISCGLNLHLDASATMCLVSRRGLGKAKHVGMQNLWIQEASKAGRFVTKKVGTNVNPADLMTKPLARPKIKQLMIIMGYEFLRTDEDSLEGRVTGA